ncbi:MAG TPA: 23S rRNA (uracil(1939)-C(5))-methyltransferase RlmD [Bacilli bacterium]|nr:23S rRNA (uracil(1939)-C(5))-methyltransferase RlmD [Bacilli bacterium]
MEYRVGQKHQVIGIDYTHDGLGVAKIDGFTIFVQNLIIGEEAEVEITFVKKSFLVGKIVKLLKISPDRIQPLCPIATACGGCQFQHLDYKKELEYKKSKVRRAFHNIAKMDLEVDEVLGSDDPYHYRNKIIMPIGYDKRKNLIHGFYRYRSHEIVAMDQCYIEDKRSAPIIHTIKDLMKELAYDPYDEDNLKGDIRKIMIRTSYYYDEIMVVIITNKETLPDWDIFTKSLLQAHPEITTLIQNINLSETNVVLGNKEIVVSGSGKIKDKLCGLEFSISSKSFYQVNVKQTEKLYQKAIEIANLKIDETVLDAYSGIGTIGMILAKHVHKVIGVEVVRQAVNDAKHNALINDIKNIEFHEADAGDFILKLEEKQVKIDTVFVDPPRKGLDAKFISGLLKLKAKSIVYISCDPATLARDVALLSELYKVEKLVVVDMFSRTYHVESIVHLSFKTRIRVLGRISA